MNMGLREAPNQQIAWNKIYLNLILGGVYCMQKWQIRKMLFDPLWSSMFGVS